MRDADAVAAVAGAMGQPSRAAMLLAMGDGQAHSASSLAVTAGILPPAASEHLQQLLRLGLVTVEAAGRERRFRLTGAEVATALEALLVVAREPGRSPPRGAIRHARTCYDHLAGKVGVAMTEGCVARGYLHRGDDAFELTPRGPRSSRRWELTTRGRGGGGGGSRGCASTGRSGGRTSRGRWGRRWRAGPWSGAGSNGFRARARCS